MKRNYNVVACSRSIPSFDESLRGGSNLYALSVDVTKPAEIVFGIKKAIEKFGGIDVLANFAGISSYETFEETSAEEVREVMETNYWGAFNTCKALITYFRENNKGTIINCTSVIGLVPRTFGCAYSSSKHALEGLTSVLWLETQNFNCRVMCVEPGLYPSNIGKGKKKYKTQYSEYNFVNTQIINLRRNYINDLTEAMKCIINTTENEKLPRRLLLGKDCIARVKYEINTILQNIKYSSLISAKIARTLEGKRYTILDDAVFYFNKIFHFFNYIFYSLVEIFAKKDKKSYFFDKKIKERNRFAKSWVNK